MSTGTIPTRSDTQTIDQTWFNTLQAILGGDLVPRNSSGVPTDAAGNLGNPSYGFSAIYLAGGGFELKLQANPSAVTAYTITLPPVPPLQVTDLQMDSSGNIVAVPRTAIKSSSSGSFTRTATSFAAVTNLSCTIVTRGGPILVLLQADGSNPGFLGLTALTGGGGSAQIEILQGSTVVGTVPLTLGTTGFIAVPALFSFLDTTPPGGTYTYTVQAKCTVSGDTVSLENCVLIVKELQP